jgi:hypothetical protein
MPSRPADATLLARRPDWLTAGTVRLLVLSVFVVAIEMIGPRMSRADAAAVVLVGAGAVVAAAVWFTVVTRRLLGRFGLVDEQQRLTQAILVEVRRIGLPLLGLAFFLVWTFVYIAVWAVHPREAFGGLESEPRFADFFYYAVSTAFTSPPEGIAAASRGARAATLIELLTALALLTAYVSSFADWRPAGEGDAVEKPKPPRP